jgi:hypothetical protein
MAIFDVSTVVQRRKKGIRLFTMKIKRLEKRPGERPEKRPEKCSEKRYNQIQDSSIKFKTPVGAVKDISNDRNLSLRNALRHRRWAGRS